MRRRGGSTGEPRSTFSGETAPARGRQKKSGKLLRQASLTLDRERAIVAPAPCGGSRSAKNRFPIPRLSSPAKSPPFRPKTVNGQDRHVRWKNRPKARDERSFASPVPSTDLSLARSILPRLDRKSVVEGKSV